MKLGLIARADNSGLGIQTWEFYRHMKPVKTMVVDISKWNNNPIFLDRYPDATVVKGTPTPNELTEFVRDLDVIFIAEAPYNYQLYQIARDNGVKTAVQYNYEFFDWFTNPHFPKPDMLIAPSRWNYDIIQRWCDENNVKHAYLHCPVARDKLPFREIKEARTFLHTAGRSAAHDRNGTSTVIAASKFLTTDAKIVIHFQGEQGLAHQATKTIADYRAELEQYGDPSKVTIVTQEAVGYEDVYAIGDVLLLPRRYGGNCLPLNEALSCGMPVIMTDISPNNSFLPKDWLIPATQIDRFAPRTVVDIYGARAGDLAARIDNFYNLTEIQMLAQNEQAQILAESISWETMKPQYEAALEALCNPS